MTAGIRFGSLGPWRRWILMAAASLALSLLAMAASPDRATCEGACPGNCISDRDCPQKCLCDSSGTCAPPR